MTTTLIASADVGYAPHRPWQQKWRDVLHGLEQIESAYAEDDMSNEPVRRMVEDFFKDCRELADWLKQSAGAAQAMSFVQEDPDLRVCDALAQTVKHHTRTKNPSRKDRDPMSARVAWVRGGGGVRVEIEWTSTSGKSGMVDALDLARRCVAAWEKFFRRHSLDPQA